MQLCRVVTRMLILAVMVLGLGVAADIDRLAKLIKEIGVRIDYPQTSAQIVGTW